MAPRSTADHAADHHRRRRQDGQDGAGRGVAQRGPAEPLRLLAILAEHGRTPMSAGSSNCSPILPLEDIGRLEALPGAEINQAKIVLATEATALLHGREAARAAAARRPRRPSPAAAWARICRRSPSATEIRTSPSADRARLLRVERRSQAQDRRRRGTDSTIEVGRPMPALTVDVDGDPVKLSLGKKKHGLLTR